ncbi:GNAT family N-acetyltransferase [Parvibaculum sp.]|uniref:GNAT family N-acetyltransferase n=1 Tax=Parvibaculum sp. TaxID=2024848 RepID=UPI002CF4A434|nr:GNAT family N-acetyltransferase [Parvibaculum sp.]HUD53211.1 GNAT family N-acetyltransferase [Parvibaculum sp.]
MKIEPRRTRPGDWPGIAPQLADVFMAARAAMLYLPALHTEEQTRAFIRDVAATQEIWTVTLPLHGTARIAGFGTIRDELGTTWLDHLYVHPAVQNHGVGDALLDAVKTQRPQGFRLWTFQQNAGARRFYESRGLVCERLTDGRDNEEKLPDALYVWRGQQETKRP